MSQSQKLGLKSYEQYMAGQQARRSDKVDPKRSKIVDEIIASAELENSQVDWSRIHPADVYWEKTSLSRKHPRERSERPRG
jgi:hypothetical protein